MAEFTTELHEMLASFCAESGIDSEIIDLNTVQRALVSEHHLVKALTDSYVFSEQLGRLALIAIKSRHFPLVRMLEDHGAYLCGPDLLRASIIDEEIFSYLYEVDKHFSGRDYDRYDQAFVLAIAKNLNGIAQICLDAPRQSSFPKYFALLVAAATGYSATRELIRDIRFSDDVEIIANKYQIALRYAALQGHQEIVELYLGICGKPDWLALYFAAYGGHEKIVEMLIGSMRGDDNFNEALFRARSVAERRKHATIAMRLTDLIKKR